MLFLSSQQRRVAGKFCPSLLKKKNNDRKKEMALQKGPEEGNEASLLLSSILEKCGILSPLWSRPLSIKELSDSLLPFSSLHSPPAIQVVRRLYFFSSSGSLPCLLKDRSSVLCVRRRPIGHLAWNKSHWQGHGRRKERQTCRWRHSRADCQYVNCVVILCGGGGGGLYQASCSHRIYNRKDYAERGNSIGACTSPFFLLLPLLQFCRRLRKCTRSLFSKTPVTLGRTEREATIEIVDFSRARDCFSLSLFSVVDPIKEKPDNRIGR